MKKFGMVLGAAAIAAIAGCKDPDYKRAGAPAGQNDVKSADTTVAPRPAAQAPAPAQKQCTCAPGTRHTRPCACGGANCFCIVEQAHAPSAGVSAAPVNPPPAVPETTTYVVQSGDYLAKISKKFNVTIAAIKKANNMTNDVVRVGQKIKIPGKVDVGAAAVQPKAAADSSKKAAPFVSYAGATKEYVVKSGDTLGAIAYSNGINIRQLKEMNGLTNDVVRVGQKLKIPAEKQVKAPATKKAATAKAAVAPKAAAEAKPVAEAKPAEAAAPAAAEKPADAAPAADAEKPAEAAAPAAAEKPADAAPATATYVVQEGDDMTGVSIRWGVSAAEIRELNNLGDSDQLKPGQILKLPAEAQQ